LGYAFGPGLLYAKGGYANYDGRVSIIDIGAGKARASGISGWTLGAGVEYRMSPVWSVKTEYQYFDFDDNRLAFPAAGRFDNDLSIQTFKLGVNYFVGHGYEPLK
jgi:outer membrane immunogenic protein